MTTGGRLTWRTSTYTKDNKTCVEVAWRTSTYTKNGESCVEVAGGPDGVLLRDTKDHGAGPVLAYGRRGWTAFIAGIRDREFDHAA